MTKPKEGIGIPWTNCRLKLEENVLDKDGDEDEFTYGVVARLHYTSSSDSAVRRSLQSLATRSLSIPAVALQSLVNRRGPDALIGCIPGEIRHSGKLLELCIRCHDSNQVLVCSNPAADLVLVPRDPEIASRDQLYFVVYATNVRAVQHCECLRLNNQVAVILDIDQTLVDATHVDLNESDMKTLEWVDVELRDFSGNKLVGRVAHAPGSDAGAPTQDRAFFITWRKRMHTYSFYVRVRRGWNEFRQFLIDNSSRFAPFVCSKGKLEYVQLIWTGLDPAGRVLSRDMWSDRIFSTFPDHLPNALDKTILSALGCATVTQNRYCSTHSQIAAPVLAVDDSPDAYETCFSDSILFVEEFRPSEAVHADRGSVLRQVSQRLERYWRATASVEGSFAWHAAQSFATAILGAMRRTPIESPAALAYLQIRCQKQGESLWKQVTVSAVFQNQVYVADDDTTTSSNSSPIGGSPRSIPTFVFERRGLSIDEDRLTVTSLQPISSSSSIETGMSYSAPASPSASPYKWSDIFFSESSGTSPKDSNSRGKLLYEESQNADPTKNGLHLRPLISQKSLNQVLTMMEPIRDDGHSGAGSFSHAADSSISRKEKNTPGDASQSFERSLSEEEAAAKTAEDLLTAALMMRC